MNKLKILIMFLAVVGLSSCDLLENQEPQQSLPSDGGLETIDDYESALVGAYNNVQEISGDNSGQLAFLNDIITEDAVWTGSFPTFVEVAEQAMTDNNTSIEGIWDGAYEAINATNIILDGVDGLDADPAQIDDIRGQAHFIRALEYYYLVNYFAKPYAAGTDNPGVPLQLTPVTSQANFDNPSRATVGDVYDQIIADLQQAQGLIANETPNRATADAATALLARIALIQERWEDAADLAGQITSNTDYMLSDDVTEYFQNEVTNSESIFEIQHTAQDVPDPANTSISTVYNAGSRDDIQISESYVEALNSIVTDDQQSALEAEGQEAIDTRVTQLLTGTEAGESNTEKYEDVVNEADNVPVLRLSEMILTRAEALAETEGINDESIELLNEIRTRAISVMTEEGAPGDQSLIEYEAADFANADELIDAILLERRVELAYEGHRKTDLQRRQMDVAGTAWDADELVFPIPQSQMDANPNIEQNPGY